MAAMEFSLGFDLDEMVDDTLADTCTLFDDNCFSSVAQVVPGKSPFHESDSGVSDLTGASPSRETEIMLDEIIDNKQFTPFGFQEDMTEQDNNLIKYLQQDGDVDVDGDSDIEKLLANEQCFKENEHDMLSVNMRAQTPVRQRRVGCHTAGSAVGPVTRHQTAMQNHRVSSDSSHSSDHESELDKAVSVIGDEFSDTGDDDDFLPRSSKSKKPRGSVRVTKPGTTLARKEPKSLPNIRCVETEPTQSGVASVKVLQVVRTSSGQHTADEVVRALEDRNRKNAEQAKINRQKKKAYVSGLEQTVEETQARADNLQKRLQEVETERDSWKKEVEYLKAVLANQSALAGLLKNIPHVEGVTLSSSFSSQKRSAEMDHSYTPSSKKQCTQPLSSAGVCLHVDSDKVSLEFCHHCAQNAKL